MVTCRINYLQMLIIALLVFTNVLFASSITKKQAEIIAEKWKENGSGHFAQLLKGLDLVIVDVKEIRDNGITYIYLIEYSNNSTIFISGDTRSIPILGYSSTPLRNIESMPIQLKELLNGYKKQIDGMKETIKDRTFEEWVDLIGGNRLDKTNSIEPMITTSWDQGVYYNTECPVDPDGIDGHALVGCVAVTMGQLMKYYNYPFVGRDSIKYMSNYGEIKVNFSSATYDYNQMEDHLQTYNPEVAKLLFHCGAAAKMDYGPYYSGTTTAHEVYALSKNFKYEQGKALWKQSYADWDIQLKKYIDERQPVIYSAEQVDANSYAQGHAFIIDGYLETGSGLFFHINWGWGGDYDGYFYLGSLAPGSSRFDDNHMAYVGIVPDTSSTVFMPPQKPAVCGLFPDGRAIYFHYVEGADYYQAEISDKESFSSSEVYQSTGLNQYIEVYNLKPDTKYFVRVKAINSYGESDYCYSSVPMKIQTINITKIKRKGFLVPTPALSGDENFHQCVVYKNYVFTTSHTFFEPTYLYMFDYSKLSDENNILFDEQKFLLGENGGIHYLKIFNNFLIAAGESIKIYDLTYLPYLKLIKSYPGYRAQLNDFINIEDNIMLIGQNIYDITSFPDIQLKKTLYTKFNWLMKYYDNYIVANSYQISLMNNNFEILSDYYPQNYFYGFIAKSQKLIAVGENSIETYVVDDNKTISPDKSYSFDVNSRAMCISDDLLLLSGGLLDISNPDSITLLSNSYSQFTVDGFTYLGDRKEDLFFLPGDYSIHCLQLVPSPTAISQDGIASYDFTLFQNYPNPFNPITKISYDIGEVVKSQIQPRNDVQVSIKVYDILGREVTTLVNQRQQAGHYEVSWDATNNVSGVYFYKIFSDNYKATKKMLLLK